MQNNQKICWCFVPKEPEASPVMLNAADYPYFEWTWGRRMLSCFPEVKRSTQEDFFHEPRVTQALLSAHEWKAVEMGDIERRLFRFGAKLEDRDKRQLREYNLSLRGLNFMREAIFLNQVNLELGQVAKLFLKAHFVSVVLYGFLREDFVKNGASEEAFKAIIGRLTENYYRLTQDFRWFFTAMETAFADKPTVAEFCGLALKRMNTLDAMLRTTHDAHIGGWSTLIGASPEEEAGIGRRYEAWLQRYVMALDRSVGETFEKLSKDMTKAVSRQ